MKLSLRLAGLFAAGMFFAIGATAQVAMSGGTYSQNFDSLANSGTPAWTDNSTLPGWYISKSALPSNVTSYTPGTGTSGTGAIYSFGTNDANGITDRALGSVASGTPGNFAYGVRFTNDTGLAQSNITVSCTGEQWRNGGNTSAQILAFSFLVSSNPITNSDAVNANNWTAFAGLDFTTPIIGSTAGALDGNNPANEQVFTNVVLPAVVQSGQEIFLRWFDANDSGTDHGVAIDNLTVSFSASTNSPATNPPPVIVLTNSSVTLMTYNVKGNGSTNWSTNSPQVAAIGREIIYLNPDIITFNEIPYTNTWQMSNWVAAFMPGFSLAVNSVTDGSIRSVIASRFPINRSQSWLPHADLTPFGYDGVFTRDLFEAEINVPNWPQPLHVFTTHLKSTGGTTYADASAKRAAEAAAITNFFATNFFVLHPSHPFTLSGDMNDSDTNALAFQRLISTPTTLRLTNPTNPVSGSINTYSIQGSLSERIDFIFPCALLLSNFTGAQVFRTDLLTPLPPNLNASDDSAASDHLPVLMTFANPFNTPFRLLAFARTNGTVSFKWESDSNRLFNIETSTNLRDWMLLATNIFTTATNSTFTTNSPDADKFFRIYRAP
jgi:endonuclease/exonuclease/phosphatase family metal-dependent hydrolase